MVVEITWLQLIPGIKCFLTGGEVRLRLSIASASVGMRQLERLRVTLLKGLTRLLGKAIDLIMAKDVYVAGTHCKDRCFEL
ncbi:hypothetical protein TNCV_4007071 [Trichonephila clavipes]|nr:hypothetical protein TNCV_4007071 [Trichonephila clavipes]